MNTTNPQILKKIRKFRPGEVFQEVAQRDFNFFISCYWLKLKSKKQLEGPIIEEALRILYRNFDILSLCIVQEDEEFWFCRMNREKIDFKIVEDKNPSDTLEEQICENFNSADGPLWRVKMVKEGISPNKSEDFGFTSNILFSFHHGITDGPTTFRLCNAFLQILNNVLDGSKEKYEDFGKFYDGAETKLLFIERKRYLENNPDVFKSLKSEMSLITKQTELLTQFYPVAQTVNPRTKTIHRQLSIVDTTNLIEKFKLKNVTFNSGFIAIANWVVVELLLENGISQDFFDIGSFHPVNMRRYWKSNDQDNTFSQGSHFGNMRVLIKTPKNVEEDFWSYAKSVNQIFKTYLDKNRALDDVIAFSVKSSTGKTTLPEIFRHPPTPKFYFNTTNMGDVTSFLPSATGKHVQLEWLTRATSIHVLNILMVHALQTYQGKLLYSLSYSTKLVTEELARKVVDRIFEKIAIVADC